MKGVKAVLFDFDETLTDAQAAIKSTHCAVVEKIYDYLHGREITTDKEKIGSDFRKLAREKNLRREYNRDTWWPELVAGFGAESPPPKLVKELTKLYWSKFAETNVSYPDAERVLDYLKKKKYKLALVTDTDGTPGNKKNRLKKSPLLRFFNVVVISGEDTPRSKPDPEAFTLVASKLGVAAKDCVMVGDKPFTDIRGAKAAGMKTIRVMRRKWEDEEEADVTVTSLSEMLKIL
jgi:putative hydrolase of the HAD superfamily